MGWHYDKETDIKSWYNFGIEGIRVEFDDRWCPEATGSLYRRGWTVSGRRELLCTTVDCGKELLWTPPAHEFLGDGVEMEYWADGYMRYEMIATRKKVDEIVCRAEYDGQDEAHIGVTHELLIGKSTVWLKVKRSQQYLSSLYVDVRFCVEFANSEECTRFLHEDMTKLERYVNDDDSDIGVIDDIIRALSPLHDDYRTAEENAVRRRIPFSQFVDEYPQPDTQLIRRRGSNRGDDRPCFLTLHLSTRDIYHISRVDWSATTIPPTFPLPSSTFQSLNHLHLKFPSHAPHDRNHDSTSRSHQEDLTITISAREISFSTSTDSVSLGNGFTVSSEHRTVTVNYIHTINGDVFSGPISRSNIGGTNNANIIRISSPVASRSPRLTWSRPRSRHTPPQPEQAESQGGVGRWVQPRPSRPRPY